MTSNIGIAGFFVNYGLFLLEAATVFVFAALIIVLLFAVLKAGRSSSKGSLGGKLKFHNLKAEIRRRRLEIMKTRYACLNDGKSCGKKQIKAFERLEKDKSRELIRNLESKHEFCPENLYVLSFVGDAKASAVNNLSLKISAILDEASDKDEVILRLESPGGTVNGYGLAAAELERLREKGIKLTVCVDEVAASGGYMMACTADKIVAAPFSYIGSIGVVAQIPNFNKLLKKGLVDYEQVTAGKFKRTLTMFGENTAEGREKFQAELEAIHLRFKEIVAKHRPKVILDDVATGEFWLARDALNLGLVDEIDTFRSYLEKTVARTKSCAIKVSMDKQDKKSLLSKLRRLVSVKNWIRQLRKELLAEFFKNNSNYTIK